MTQPTNSQESQLTAPKHIPVLPEAVCSFLAPESRTVRRIIDGTVGYGGHSALLLQRKPGAELLGLDRDEDALAASRERLSFAGDRVHLVHSDYSRMADRAAALGWDKVDTILLDIGVSSRQIDDAERGFSFRFAEAPLDMRMDRSRGRTAADIVNTQPEEELTTIFRDYGEIREARRLARRIVELRKTSPIRTCGELAAVCDETLGGPRHRKGGRKGPPAPTLAFQALRIAVNGELDELREGLQAAVELLSPGGRMAVISFHSLEDRIVKNFIREMAMNCKCPPGTPVCICSWRAVLKPLTKKPVEADERELVANPRAACAKLRAAEKL
jgi:16S rRNA (cytosine1402-N4)-methyltransferase